MRRRQPLLRLAALAMAVSVVSGLATLPVSGADSPVGAVDAVLDAIVAGEPGDLKPLMCAQQRSDTDPVLDLAGLVGLGVLDAAPLMDGATVRLADRAVTVLEEAADTASVAVSGSLQITLESAVARAWVGDQLEAAGQPTQDDAVDRSLADLLSVLEADLPIATTVEVVREDGTWLLCDVIRPGLAFDPDATATPITGALCDLMTVDELNAATGFAFTVVTPFDDGCSWDSAIAAGYHSVSLHRATGTLDEIRAVWRRGRELTVDGRSGWATNSGTWVEVADGLLAILPHLEGAPVPVPMDAITFGRTVAELVVPRLP